MRDDSRLGITTLAAAALAVAIAGCSSGALQTRTEAPAETTVSAAPEPTASPAAMVERAEAAVPPPASNGFAPRADLMDVLFRSGQIGVTKADYPTLDAVVRWLREHPAAAVMIEGHTDDLGNREANLAIGEKRALSIEKYLVARGIEPERVSVATAGSDRPLCEQKTDACRAKNRRARFLVRQP